MKKEYKDFIVGDKVLLTESGFMLNDRKNIKEVVKITPKFFFLDGGEKFRRKDGCISTYEEGSSKHVSFATQEDFDMAKQHNKILSFRREISRDLIKKAFKLSDEDVSLLIDRIKTMPLFEKDDAINDEISNNDFRVISKTVRHRNFHFYPDDYIELLHDLLVKV